MHSVKVRSLLRERSGEFTPVESAAPRKRRWVSVEGAIELTVGEKPVLTSEEWDDVYALWMYISGMVHRLCHGETQALTYFPDQPISFRLRRESSGMMTVGCESKAGGRRAMADEKELLAALSQGGIAFFDQLVRLGEREENHAVERKAFVDCLERMNA